MSSSGPSTPLLSSWWGYAQGDPTVVGIVVAVVVVSAVAYVVLRVARGRTPPGARPGPRRPHVGRRGRNPRK